VWPITSPEQVQMIHRFGAVIAGTFAVWAALRVRKEAEGSLLVQRLALAPIVLVVMQVTLGVISVLSLLNLVVITTHLAVGALLLGSFVLLWGLCPAPARPEGSRLDHHHPSSDAMVAS
jgi:heme A synthase